MAKGYKLGLALSGGGLRGAVHLGVLKALTDNGIFPDIVAGTSSGSIIGAIYATGADSKDIVKKFSGREAWDLLDPTKAYLNWFLRLCYRFTKRTMALWQWPQGFFKGEKLECYFDQIFEGKGFEDLLVPLSVVCADIDTGESVIYCPLEAKPKRPPEGVVFRSDEKLSAAVRGSISLPGVFTPLALGGRRLVDGGIKNNIPADLLFMQGAKKVIAVDLGVTGIRSRPETMTEIIMASLDIMGDELSRHIRKESPAYYIFPDLQGVGYKDYERIPEIISFGENAANKMMPEIKKYLSKA